MRSCRNYFISLESESADWPTRVSRSFENIESTWREIKVRGARWAFQTYDWVKTWRETVGRQSLIKERYVK
jgi:hypothetical protein